MGLTRGNLGMALWLLLWDRESSGLLLWHTGDHLQSHCSLGRLYLSIHYRSRNMGVTEVQFRFALRWVLLCLYFGVSEYQSSAWFSGLTVVSVDFEKYLADMTKLWDLSDKRFTIILDSQWCKRTHFEITRIKYAVKIKVVLQVSLKCLLWLTSHTTCRRSFWRM